MKRLLFVWAMACMAVFSYTRHTYYSELKGDTLTIGNERIERKFVWNGGNLMTYSLSDKIGGKTSLVAALVPDFFISNNVKVGASRNRDEMIMMNTWGDRSQDLRINENF